MWIDGRKNVLLAHAGTAFPIFVADVRVSDLRPLGPGARATIHGSLADEGLPAGTLGSLGIGEPLIAKTANRQLRGRRKTVLVKAGGKILAFLGSEPASRAGVKCGPIPDDELPGAVGASYHAVVKAAGEGPARRVLTWVLITP